MKKIGAETSPTVSRPQPSTLRSSKGVIERCFPWVQPSTLSSAPMASEAAPCPTAHDVCDAVARVTRWPARSSTCGPRAGHGRRSGREARRAQ